MCSSDLIITWILIYKVVIHKNINIDLSQDESVTIPDSTTSVSTTTLAPTTTPAPTTTLVPTTTLAPTTTPAPTPALPPYYISWNSPCQYIIQSAEECGRAAYNHIGWRSSSSSPRAYDQSLSSAPTGCYIDCRNPQSSMCRNRYSGVYFKSAGTDAGCSTRYPCI